MPVSTDSAAWENGEEPESREHLILDFLKDNPDEAFNIREIVENIGDIDWTGLEDQWRKQDELPDDEYIDDEEYEEYPITFYYRATELYKERLSSLVGKGLVDAKNVDAEEFGDEIPDEWEEATAYSYHSR